MMVYGSELLRYGRGLVLSMRLISTDKIEVILFATDANAPALVQFRIYISVLEILSKYVDT